MTRLHSTHQSATLLLPMLNGVGKALHQDQIHVHLVQKAENSFLERDKKKWSFTENLVNFFSKMDGYTVIVLLNYQSSICFPIFKFYSLFRTKVSYTCLCQSFKIRESDLAFFRVFLCVDYIYLNLLEKR